MLNFGENHQNDSFLLVVWILPGPDRVKPVIKNPLWFPVFLLPSGTSNTFTSGSSAKIIVELIASNASLTRHEMNTIFNFKFFGYPCFTFSIQ